MVPPTVVPAVVVGLSAGVLCAALAGAGPWVWPQVSRAVWPWAFSAVVSGAGAAALPGLGSGVSSAACRVVLRCAASRVRFAARSDAGAVAGSAVRGNLC
jgi:hypothetical protein